MWKEVRLKTERERMKKISRNEISFGVALIHVKENKGN